MKNENNPTVEDNETGEPIRLGEEMLTVEKGVLGFNGFVPLGERLCFASVRTLREYFEGKSDEDIEPVHRGRRVA